MIEIIKYSILFIPLWWFCGITFIIFHFVVLSLFLFLIIKKKNLNLPKAIVPLIIFISIYIISVAINYDEIHFDRLLASLYNLSFWVIGLFLIIATYNIKITKKHLIKISGALTIFGTINGILVVFGILLWLTGNKNIGIYSPVYKFLSTSLLDKAPLIKSTFIFNIVESYYTSLGILPRSSLFFPYSTAFGMGMLITIPATIYYFKSIQKFKKLIISLFFQFTALLFSLSRICIIGLALAIFYVYIFSKKKLLLMAMLLFGLTLGLLVESDIVFKDPLNFIKKIKEGSTLTRFYLYKYTVMETLKKPFIGYGYKPREEWSDIPIASHSTFLGIFYKTGLFGFINILIFWLIVYITWWKRKLRIRDKICNYLWDWLGISFIGGLIWQLFDDLDAVSIIAFLYFLIVALIISYKKMVPFNNI